MGRGLVYHVYGVKIPWVGVSKYHESGIRYTMGRGFIVPYERVGYTMG